MASFPVYQHTTGSLDQYLREINNYELLTRKQERELSARALQGDEVAIDKLVRSNLRFVVSFVKKYQNRGVDLPDLIAVGNHGLHTAAKKFDAETYERTKFISYAVHWIHQAVRREIAEQGKAVRIPLNKVANIYRAEKALKKYKSMELPDDQARERAADELDISVESLDSLLLLQGKSVSLDAPASPNGDGDPLSELYATPAEDGADANLYETATSEAINEALDQLKPREALIVRLYYGLEDGREYTLEEIGQRLGVTRERIRQIRNKAFERLRSPRFKHLEQLLD